MKCLIVDDERLAREELRFLLSRHAEVEIVGEAANVPEALKITRHEQPEIVFLDVQLLGESGFDFVGRMDEPHPRIVFVTAHDAHAVRAFECNALDYLLKPVNPKRLSESLARLSYREVEPVLASCKDMVLLRFGSTARFVPWASVQRVTTEGDYTRVFLDDGVEGLILRPLKEWLKLAPLGSLMRIHRQALVCPEAISEVRLVSKDRREVVLLDGATLPIGRDYWPEIRELVSSRSSKQ